MENSDEQFQVLAFLFIVSIRSMGSSGSHKLDMHDIELPVQKYADTWIKLKTAVNSFKALVCLFIVSVGSVN